MPHLLADAELEEWSADSTPEAHLSELDAINKVYEEWLDDNNKVLGFINLKISASIQQIIHEYQITKELWQWLATTYRSSNSAGIYNDFQAVTDWKFDDKKDPNISTSKLMAHIKQLVQQGVPLPDNVCARILLKALPRNWENFAGVILATMPAKDLTVTGVMPLIHEEWRCHHPQLSAFLSQCVQSLLP